MYFSVKVPIITCILRKKIFKSVNILRRYLILNRPVHLGPLCATTAPCPLRLRSTTALTSLQRRLHSCVIATVEREGEGEKSPQSGEGERRHAVSSLVEERQGQG